MHKREDHDCKVLFVTMTFNYLKIFFFWNRISLDLNYSRLAGTPLTVKTEMFKLGRSKGLRYLSDYVNQPPGKSIQYK